MDCQLIVDYDGKWRFWFILGLAFSISLIIMNLDPIAQDTSYHDFVDFRKMFGVSNFWNFISNLPFILVGFLGIVRCQRAGRKKVSLFNQAEFTFFMGIFLTGFGSAYYHLAPDNETLVSDRIPMTIAFMAFSSMIVQEYLNREWGKKLLAPLLFLGVCSVFYWAITENLGYGDLRPYILVQFLPILIFPVTIFLLKSERFTRIDMLIFLLFYLAAKVFEHFDLGIYDFGNLVSGHTLKHFAAAAGGYWLLKVLNNATKIFP
ncbi:MAG: ceramidase [Proteobacteria bacterium]|nr:ceramidase [Pseudomonadota bacterium]MBU1716668.1 ceramidase [Pseudomonadota bacterium]